MLNLEQIQNYFPPQIRENAVHKKYIVKEYIQLLILNFLAASKFAKKITFIGGTNLRLVKGIDRFSEDLDFDCKDFYAEDFAEMSQSVLIFLQRSGIRAEAREKQSEKIAAFRSRIYFPELLFELGLSAYKEERFLIKLESQNQEFEYAPKMANISSCGFFISLPVPPDDVLCAMKLSALLSRAKGRDFYDALFLLSQAKPNYDFLTQKQHIHNLTELKEKLIETVEKVDLRHKSKDFEHLLFNKENKNKILNFSEFVRMLS
ncbi:MAG: nucleotidyl transferase AbiEii/AbiGii toxin family protein [Prevotellaceae bacterium]|jgi:predicted nucleotidyltransferase component of viral defense system|nr:nucleotidyl transferase AbiEii/AbiGii toxin family protein [Prevotellaceae bacterium]